MKKVLSLFLVWVMVLTLIPLGAVTASAETRRGTTGDCTWTLVDGVLTISGNGKMGDYSSCEGDNAPWRGVREVIVEKGVTVIGAYAFQYSSIYYIDLPEGVERINEKAFYSSKLTAITIPYSVKTIGREAFGRCRDLSDVYYNGNHIERQKMKIVEEQTWESDDDYIIEANWHYVGYETLIKTAEDTWCYYVGGVKRDHTTLVKYKNKWFYVENGFWNITATTLVEYKGKWFGVVNGKWDSSIKTLIKYKDKWFYVKNGKWCQDTTIVKYKGKRFYVKNGKVDFGFSGKKKINGKTYKIKNGKVL
jgi:hypothetical protein